MSRSHRIPLSYSLLLLSFSICYFYYYRPISMLSAAGSASAAPLA